MAVWRDNEIQRARRGPLPVPIGTWRQRLIPGICKHEKIRCTHGDEIMARGWRRQVCLICGRSLKGPLPDMCFFTGKPHGSTRWLS